MKKSLIIITSTILIFILICLNFNKTFEVDKQLEGLTYGLGDSKSMAQASVLRIVGHARTNITGKLWFDGVIELEGKKFNLNYEENVCNFLSYSRDGNTRVFGDIYIDSGFSKVAIRNLESGWSLKDGQTFIYPCDSKEEALEIVKLLMGEELD